MSLIITPLRLAKMKSSGPGGEDAAKADITALASDLNPQDPESAAGPSYEQIKTLAVAMTTLFCGLNKFCG